MIIDGKKVSDKIKSELKNKVYKLKEGGIVPGLAVILVGNNPASKIYVKNKQKACEEIGIQSRQYLLDEKTSQKDLLELIEHLNKSTQTHGILVQFPLPSHIDEFTVAQAINAEKDVDCFNASNVGKLILDKSNLLPCTPAGIIELLKRYHIQIQGKNCTIVGRSNIVGKPLALMMLKENSTVTICHSKTLELENFCRQADILISAVGKQKTIKADMVKPKATVIDVGINRNSEGKICGDVDFSGVFPKAGFITPVPGGVGPMTIAMLMKNVICAAELHLSSPLD